MKIKLIKLTINFLLVVIFLLLNSNASAQTIEVKKTDSTLVVPAALVEVTVEINYLKSYLWRSISFGSNDVAQPFISLSYKNVFVNLASNINYIPKNLPKEQYSKKVAYDEQDFEVGFTGNIKKLDFEVKADAYIYFFQPVSPSTAELNLKLSHPIYKTISAFSENVIDIAAYSGSYFNNTGLNWDYTKANTNFVLQTGLGFGNKTFNGAYFGGETNGLFYWGSKAEITHNLKSYYIKVMGEYNYYAKKEIRTITEKSNTTNFAFSVGRNFRFKLRK
jgi:hypothetical protein